MLVGIFLQKHAFATLCGILAPALLPRGSIVYEQGGHFIDGIERKFLIEVSPDGYTEVPEDEHLRNVFGNISENVVELKCPFPEGNYIKGHHSIPVYYAIQLLCQMKVKNANKA